MSGQGCSVTKRSEIRPAWVRAGMGREPGPYRAPPVRVGYVWGGLVVKGSHGEGATANPLQK